MVELASDFLDRNTPVFRDDVCFFLSQSGMVSLYHPLTPFFPVNVSLGGKRQQGQILVPACRIACGMRERRNWHTHTRNGEKIEWLSSCPSACWGRILFSWVLHMVTVVLFPFPVRKYSINQQTKKTLLSSGWRQLDSFFWIVLGV